RGCPAPAAVIIRTKAGYRAGLRDSLAKHGNQLSGEFPIINAVAARVACGDLETLASFDSTLSVSLNARMQTTQVDDPAAVPSMDPPAPPVNPPAPAPDPRNAEGQAAAAL